ncbi:MAG: PEP/pyruvate-binding domain-containing protein, partial [Owenweeksia sp.]
MNNKTEKYGGKGSNLFLLKEAGFPVPEFVVLPVKGCTSHLYEFLDQHPHGTFAVRSSATAEDSDSQSFAGQFKTFLNVPAAKIEERIDAVKVSLRQEHISRYSEGPLQMAVVVQRMVKADVSGVIFTADPVSGHRNKTIISATYGLGEGLVSGEFDADTFTFRDGSWNNHIVQKEYKKEMSADGLHNLKVDENLQEIPCLNEGLLEKLRGISEKIESYFGQPQDIEFAVEGETIWILQSRPITTLKQGNHIIWDNSNIVESYPGITQPLTFSFILRIYKAVYEQLSGILGVPAKTIKEKEEVYANMLGLLKGRVYYNLINWYRVLAMVPCFSLNSGFMEKMMGTTSSYELPKDDHSRLWATRWHFLLSVFKILRAYRKLRRETREFQDYFNEVMQEYNQMDFESMEAWEVKEKLKRFENILLVKWRPPLVNDFFAMIFFGLFEKYTRKW